MSGKSIATVQKNSYSGNRLVPQPINLLASSQDMEASKNDWLAYWDHVILR